MRLSDGLEFTPDEWVLMEQAYQEWKKIASRRIDDPDDYEDPCICGGRNKCSYCTERAVDRADRLMDEMRDRGML